MQVVYGHLDDPQGQEIKRGASYLKLRPGMLLLLQHSPRRCPSLCSHVFFLISCVHLTTLCCLTVLCGW